MSTVALQFPSKLNGARGPIVVMGISGCGKSSVGQLLASILGYRFIEGDSRHPTENVEKMRNGIALVDADRWPWLEALGAELSQEGNTVISCSSLKRSYRDLLRAKAGRSLIFVFLNGSRSTLVSRMAARDGHYMPLSLLESQLATLEIPVGEPDVVTVEIEQPVERIVSEAIARIAGSTLWQQQKN